MRPIKYLGEEFIIKKAIDTLMKELGPAETVRFITMQRKKEWRV